MEEFLKEEFKVELDDKTKLYITEMINNACRKGLVNWTLDSLYDKVSKSTGDKKSAVLFRIRNLLICQFGPDMKPALAFAKVYFDYRLFKEKMFNREYRNG